MSFQKPVNFSDLSAADMHDLEELNLEQNKTLSDEYLIEVVSKCPNLRKIAFNNRYVSEDALTFVAVNCARLEQVELTTVTDAELNVLGKYCQNLSVLKLKNGRQITGLALTRLFKSCSLLTDLSINACGSLNEWAEDFHATFRLHSLRIVNCTALSAYGLENLLMLFPNLMILELGKCHHINNKAFWYITQYCKKLEYLDLSGLMSPCNFNGDGLALLKNINLESSAVIVDESLIELANLCPNLEVANLSYCENITVKGVQALINKCPNMQRIHLYKCKITENELKELENTSPQLCIHAYRGLRAYSDTNKDFSFDYFVNTPERLIGLDNIDLALQLSSAIHEQHFLCISSEALSDLEVSEKINSVSELRKLELYDLNNSLVDLQRLNTTCLISLAVELPHCTDIGIQNLLKNESNILEIELSSCWGLTNVTLECISNNCPNLVSFKVDLNSYFTHAGILSLVRKCKNLVSLHLEHCDKIREEGLEPLYITLVKEFPKLGFYLH